LSVNAGCVESPGRAARLDPISERLEFHQYGKWRVETCFRSQVRRTDSASSWGIDRRAAE
jgi:hypothetical protein